MVSLWCPTDGQGIGLAEGVPGLGGRLLSTTMEPTGSSILKEYGLGPVRFRGKQVGTRCDGSLSED